MIQQGDVYWIDLGELDGSGPGYRHPHVVVQNNIFNQSRLNTVVVCALTSNLKRANAPGHVELQVGEGGLPKASVALVTQLFTVDKSQLEDKMGQLSAKRLRQILDGIRLVLEPKSLD